MTEQILSEHPGEKRRWTREVLRRGSFELLYLASNLAIVICGLVWLYRLFSHAPGVTTGAMGGIAVLLSIACYHFARWRASALMSQQVEKLIAWAIVTFGMALVWGAICCAFVYSLLRWIGVSSVYDWGAGGALGICGFAYMVVSDWSGLDDCLAMPAAARVQPDPTAA